MISFWDIIGIRWGKSTSLKCPTTISYGQRARLVDHTIIEVSSKFVVGAAFDHFRDVLRLLVDGHGSDNAAMWRGGRQLDLDWTGLGNLTVELLQQGRILGGKRIREARFSDLSLSFWVSVCYKSENKRAVWIFSASQSVSYRRVSTNAFAQHNSDHSCRIKICIQLQEIFLSLWISTSY